MFPTGLGVELGVLEVAFLPIALQEMVFAVYLIVRGFDTKAIAALSEARPRVEAHQQAG